MRERCLSLDPLESPCQVRPDVQRPCMYCGITSFVPSQELVQSWVFWSCMALENRALSGFMPQTSKCSLRALLCSPSRSPSSPSLHPYPTVSFLALFSVSHQGRCRHPPCRVSPVQSWSAGTRQTPEATTPVLGGMGLTVLIEEIPWQAPGPSEAHWEPEL